MPINLGHYVENIGNKTLHYLEIFNTGEFLTVFAIDHWS
jgi:oxalate decarboxylase/phosphoglucose isomerase-like protein (cupin superfamily)